MSGASRTTSGTARRATRNYNSSPYRRPPPKKSSWSLAGLLSHFNPLRLFSAPSDEQTEAFDYDAAHAPVYRDEQLSEQNEPAQLPLAQQALIEHENIPPPPPLTPPQNGPTANTQMKDASTSSPESVDSIMSTFLDEVSDPGPNLEIISKFLASKGNEKLNRVEFAGIVAMLEKRVKVDEEREPFRFTTSTPPPERGSTPTFTTPNSSSPAPTGTSSQPPRKTLAKNPNGTYIWYGAGSSRPRRNRYVSPGFGPSKPSPSGIKLTPEKPKTDAKRRRVGEDAETSAAQRVTSASTSGAHPAMNGIAQPTAGPSTPSTNGAPAMNGAPPSSANVNGTHVPPASPRFRTTGLPTKPTTPARPSPLRQAWGQPDRSPPQPPQQTQPAKPTRAASFMTELIKEVTPPKKPDLVNPYQAASPLPPRPSKKPPVKRARSATAKPAAEAELPTDKKGTLLSPQRIIEATVPKGSTRSRPPPDLSSRVDAPTSGPFTAAPRRSTFQQDPECSAAHGTNGRTPTTSREKRPPSVIVEEVSDEEGGSPPKKQKLSVPQVNGRRKPTPPTVTVEEIDDVDMPQATKPSQSPTYMQPSEVIEPSENRDRSRSTSPSAPIFRNPFSASPAQRSAFGNLKSSAPRAPSKLRFSIQVDKEEKEKEETVKPPPTVPSVHSFALPQPMKPAAVQPVTPQDAKTIAMAMDVDKLPKYTFPLPTSSPGAGPSSFKARQKAIAAPVSSLPTFGFSKSPLPAASSTGFNWAAAGMKQPETPAGESWTCSICMLSNPASATEKCSVCDAPRANKPKPAATGFNWAAAGMKPPVKSVGESWTCKTCMLSNPASATEKCIVCDSPR
ncbi:hypothetical protein AcW2_005459 [Taiwanofungus camphoratus]|nr:hypothetical protein AcW2_005459 [Antrodia cinnamomea]